MKIVFVTFLLIFDVDAYGRNQDPTTVKQAPTTTTTTTTIYSADLLYKLFQLTSEDTKYLDGVLAKHNKNGVFDKAAFALCGAEARYGCVISASSSMPLSPNGKPEMTLGLSASYYAEIAQTNTAVHRKMELWREIIRKVEKEDPLADQFLTVLMRTARAVRFGEVHQPLESNTILESFYGMPKRRRNTLKDYCRPLNSFLHSRTEFT